MNRERQHPEIVQLSRLCVRDVMRSPLPVVQADDTLRETAQRMWALNEVRLPVCEGRTLVGLISLRDLTVRATAEGLDPAKNTVREVMSRYFPCVAEEQPLSKAALIMHNLNLSVLPVVNRQTHLVGRIHLNDLGRHR